jgi:hypothetical protein
MYAALREAAGKETGEKELDLTRLYVMTKGVKHASHRTLVEGRLVRLALRHHYDWEEAGLGGIAYELPLTGLA